MHRGHPRAPSPPSPESGSVSSHSGAGSSSAPPSWRTPRRGSLSQQRNGWLERPGRRRLNTHTHLSIAPPAERRRCSRRACTQGRFSTLVPPPPPPAERMRSTFAIVLIPWGPYGFAFSRILFCGDPEILFKALCRGGDRGERMIQSTRALGDCLTL